MDAERTEAHSHDHGPTTLTRNQQLVLAALERAPAPQGAYALLDVLRGDGFRAPLQVYRALDKLTKAGLVHRLESLNAFVACADPHCHGSRVIAFAICERCGVAEEVSDAALETRVINLARTRGFAPKRAVIEIRGRCADCTA